MRFYFLVLVFLMSQPVFAWQEGAGYLRLQDKLDRPEDGYCLDVAGSGKWADVTVPLNVHNCKGPHFYADEAVIFHDSGYIRFPAYNLCVTAVGRNGRTIAKSPLILRHCANQPESPKTAFNPPVLQIFVHREDGRIALKNTDLCMVAGAQSDTTFSEEHKWRALYLDDCDSAPESLSVWQKFTAIVK